MTSVSKKMCILINQTIQPINTYKSTFQETIKRKPVNVKCKESIDKDLKSKIVDHVKISKYKNIFLRGYAPNCFEEVFVIKKIKCSAIDIFY